MKRLSRYKKGSAVFIVVIILSMVSAMLSLGTAKVSQAAMCSTNSNKSTIQAQQYAESKADVLKSISYSNLVSQGKSSIPNSDNYFDEVIVDSESNYASDSNIKQRKCTVNVYKGSEPLPRSTLNFFRYSVAASDVDIGEPEYLGSGPRTFVAKEAGFVTVGGSNGSNDMDIKVNGKTLGYVIHRRYGTGNISACVPVPKGATVSFTGYVDWAYWSKLKA